MEGAPCLGCWRPPSPLTQSPLRLPRGRLSFPAPPRVPARTRLPACSHPPHPAGAQVSPSICFSRWGFSSRVSPLHPDATRPLQEVGDFGSGAPPPPTLASPSSLPSPELATPRGACFAWLSAARFPPLLPAWQAAPRALPPQAPRGARLPWHAAPAALYESSRAPTPLMLACTRVSRLPPRTLRRCLSPLPSPSSAPRAPLPVSSTLHPSRFPNLALPSLRRRFLLSVPGVEAESRDTPPRRIRCPWPAAGAAGLLPPPLNSPNPPTWKARGRAAGPGLDLAASWLSATDRARAVVAPRRQ